MLVASSPAVGVGREEQLHPLGEIGTRRFEDQVKVIGQNDERVKHPAGPIDGTFQAYQEPAAITIVRDDILPTVTPGHDMVDGVGVLNSQSSRHRLIKPAGTLLFNKKILTRSDPEGDSIDVLSRPPGISQTNYHRGGRKLKK